MAFLNIERVNAVPGSPAASTLYLVKGSEAGTAEIHLTNNDGSEVRRLPTKADITSLINTAVADFNNIKVVADITARDALAPTRNVLALALDATDDNTVNAGAALYIFDVDGDNWTKVSEFESMEVQLLWSSISGRPTSSVADIDEAVSLRHSHDNLAQLDKIGEDGQGNLQYDGAYPKLPLGAAAW